MRGTLSVPSDRPFQPIPQAPRISHFVNEPNPSYGLELPIPKPCPNAAPKKDRSAGGRSGRKAAPAADCADCPRLATFRHANQRAYPDWHNGPVPAFGRIEASVLIVGLAPGLKGANQTGRPFTGDYAGDLLYRMLQRYGFAQGNYGATASDGLELCNCRITNAVRCVPPENRPTTDEIKTCNGFLRDEIAAMAKLGALLALGQIAHNAILRALDLKRSASPFRHGARYPLGNGLQLFDSYHCSRYNTNTGRLTEEMFEAVIRDLQKHVSGV